MEQLTKRNLNHAECFRAVHEFCELSWDVVFADSLFDPVFDPKTTGLTISKALDDTAMK
jgi:hypothetical protein